MEHNKDNKWARDVLRIAWFGVNLSVWVVLMGVLDAKAQDEKLPECETSVHVMSLKDGLALDDSSDFRHRSAFFFNRITVQMIDNKLGNTPPGEAMRAVDLFSGRDARWRLLRPVPTTDDPDALVLSPPQSQYLIRPMPAANFSALILVGLEANGKVERPALSGRLKRPDERLFTIEPTDPASCQISPEVAAGWTDALLEKHITLIED